MNRPLATLAAVIISALIGALIGYAFFAAMPKELKASPGIAFKDVPWSSSAAHRANFHANPSLLA